MASVRATEPLWLADCNPSSSIFVDERMLICWAKTLYHAAFDWLCACTKNLLLVWGGLVLSCAEVALCLYAVFCCTCLD